MARSAEKKMTALARWRAVYEDKISYKERPKLASECEDLGDALGFRRSIVSEITKKIAMIQNPSLGEFKLRDLNDEINRLIRERRHWDNRILELGGKESKNSFVLPVEREGRSLEKDGYKYFGAVRELPGVRELFRHQIEPPPKKSRMDLSLTYYGVSDEADGVLLKLENDHKTRHEFYKEWKKKKSSKKVTNDESDDKVADTTKDESDDNEESSQMIVNDPIHENINTIEENNSQPSSLWSTDFETRVKRFSHKEVPSQAEVEKVVVGLKKDKVLKEYMSEEFLEQLVDSGSLMGVEVDINLLPISSNVNEQEKEKKDANK